MHKAKNKPNLLWMGEKPDSDPNYQLLKKSDRYNQFYTKFDKNIYTFIEKTEIEIIGVNFVDFPHNFGQLVDQLKEIVLNHKIPVLFIIPLSSRETTLIIDSFDFYDILYMPFNYGELHWRLEKLFRIRDLEIKLYSYEESINFYDRQLKQLNDLFTQMIPSFAPYAVTADEHIQKKIGLFLRKLSDGVGAETTILLHFSPEEKELVLEATHAMEDKLNFQFDDPLLAETAQNFQIQLLENTTQIEDNNFIKDLSKTIGSRIFSLILVPIVLESKLYGIFVVINKLRGKFFTTLDKSFAQIAANYFSKELHNVEVFKNATSGGNIADLASPFISHVNAKMEFMHSILDSVLFGVIVLNHYNQIIYMNKASERILERTYKEQKDLNFSTLFGEDLLSDSFFNQEEDESGVSRFEAEVKMKSGRNKFIGFSSQLHRNFLNQPIGRIITLRDISMFLVKEKEIMRMDKLASLGIMVSGIAHEIRNPLAGINAVAQALEAELKEEGNDKSEYVERIIRQVNRLNNLLQALFVYSRPERPDIEKIDLKMALEEVKPLVEKVMIDKKILYQEYIDQGSLLIPADPELIQQMFLNLMLNAVEAMSEQGVLTVSMENIPTVSTSVINKMTYIQRQFLDEAVRITVADSGEGVSEEELENIFTPFFTTKNAGTGLGLAIVQQIVDTHRGYIEVESEMGKGTRFIVYLPIKREISR